MNAILLTQSFNNAELTGGVERHSALLKEVFPELKVIDAEKAKKEFLLARIPLPHFNEIKNAFFVQKYLLKHLKELKPEIIFTQGMFGFLLNEKNTNAKIINFCHGTYAALAENAFKKNFGYWKTKNVFAHYEKNSAKNASIVIANSEFTQKNIKKYFALESKVIYNPINLNEWLLIEKEKARKKLKIPLNKKIALFVGRPDYSKGFDLFIEIAKSMPEILFIAITFPKAKINQKNIICLNAMPWLKLNEYYNAADIILFPSRFEGFGFVTIEALALNKPVVCLNTGIASELNGKISNLIIAEKENLKEKTIEALEMKAKESRSKIKEMFSIEEFKKRLNLIVSELNK